MVLINGEPHPEAVGLTLAAFVAQVGLQPTRIAVEYNGAILSRDTYAHTVLQDGDSVEIVNFVGGG
nr:sulfur carrier protein ThiS [Maliibacterium massiliense]